MPRTRCLDGRPLISSWSATTAGACACQAGWRGRPVVRIVLAALMIALLAGCGGTTDGTAIKGTTPAADPSALDPGSYPTTPRPPLGEAGTDEVGRFIEGRRMASFVVGPWQVDPTLSRIGSAPAKV